MKRNLQAGESSGFLAWMEEARVQLAHGLFLRNRKIRNATSLARCVDRTVIRILFTRMCEERGIHSKDSPGEALADLANVKEFEGRTVPDDFFANFIDQFSSHQSSSFPGPIPVEMLGTAYERFLGSTITLDKGGPRFEPTGTRKNGGVYYTPRYIVEYIVEATVGKLVSGKSPREMRQFRFLDPACGAGRFLLRVYERILEEHIRWFRLHPEQQKGHATKDPHGNIRLKSRTKVEILTNCIFGVDLDAEAVEVTKLSLYLKALEDNATVARNGSVDLKEKPGLLANIKCGNSLISGVLASAHVASAPFVWEQEFPAVFGSGGFHVVLGNPPYGAEVTAEMRKYLANRFDIGSTDTAALMMVHALRDLTRAGGMNGFIVPKAFTYSSNWEKVRDELLGGITEIVDVGKVWPQVKLEQVIYFATTTPLKEGEVPRTSGSRQRAQTPAKRLDLNGAPSHMNGVPGYTNGPASYANRKRSGERFGDVAVIEKEHCCTFGFLLNGITRDELRVGLKIRSARGLLSEYVSNTRGAMFQEQVTERARGRRVIGGKQVQRYQIAGEKGFVSSRASIDNNAFVAPDSILVQNIIAHIENPIDHIKITAALVDEQLASEIVILDTVNQVANRSILSPYFFLAILNSRLMNWYVYRFIYAKAIRTMHFDGPVTSRIPIPRVTAQNKHLYEEIVEAAKLLQSNQSCDDAGIEGALHHLYGLTAEDVEVIERGMPHGEKHSRTVAATSSPR